MVYGIDIDEEVYELQGVFPGISREDFYQLDNGNVGVVVYYRPDDFSFPEFEVLLEYPAGYPDLPPKAWILDPELEPGTKHVWGTDEYGSPMVCFIDPDDWSPDLTSYDAAVMVKTWIYAYCNWVRHDEWSWDEKAHGSPSSSLFDLLPF